VVSVVTLPKLYRPVPRVEQSQTFGDNVCHPEPFASLKGKLREGPLKSYLQTPEQSESS